jgi:antirestriction protein ArdC
MSDNDKASKHAALLTRLSEQVESLVSSDGWQAWLRTAARFREYSLRNQLLILSQRPEATRVAGYRTWQQLGRHVRRGERGIAIFAPLIRRTADAADEEPRAVVSGFRVVHVFDVAQTDGDALPTIEQPTAALDDAGLLDRIHQAASGAGIDVAELEASDPRLDGARGLYVGSERAIYLVAALSTANKARTLVHELAHYSDHELGGWEFKGSRAVCEVVAESATFLVGSGLDIDLQDASTVYVASWLPHDGEQRKHLEEVAARVLAVADPSAGLGHWTRSGLATLCAAHSGTCFRRRPNSLIRASWFGSR